jgi:enterochelin esterase family protein
MQSLGFIERHPLKSQALLGNRFNDPSERVVTVYLPPTYQESAERRYPTVYLLPSHGNTGAAMLNWKPWAETMEQRLDRLMGQEGLPAAIVVMPDLWTSLGGAQYLDSAIGQYETHFIQELVPFVDSHYRTSDSRALIGHSSGGYGALVYAMKHPQLFSACACHSGDMYWEFTCLPGISRLHQGLSRYGGAEAFLAGINTIQPKNTPFWDVLMTLCWSLAHGANPDAPLGFDLPIDPQTGALDQAVWERWLTFDPLRMIETPDYQAALRAQRHIYLTAGLYDEYQLQVGARLFSRKLTELGIAHLHEELPVSHSGSDVPYDRSLRLLLEALAS